MEKSSNAYLGFSILPDEVTRDYLGEGVSDALLRKLRMLPWFPEDMSHLSFELREGDEAFFMVRSLQHVQPNTGSSGFLLSILCTCICRCTIGKSSDYLGVLHVGLQIFM